MWISPMGQCVWPGKKIGGQRANRKGGRVPPADCRPKPCCSAGAPDRANAGHRLQCLVKLKLFRRGFFFPRCAAVGCRTGSRRSARGSSTCRTRLFFIVALTSSPTSSPIFSARNPASSANCLIISCVSGNGVMRSRPLYSILIANRGRPFGVFTRTGSENDLPLSIGMAFRFPPLRAPRSPTPQQAAKMLPGAALLECNAALFVRFPTNRFCCRLARAGLMAPIREPLSGISENRISSAPGCQRRTNPPLFNRCGAR
jgi:hypothetical protein